MCLNLGNDHLFPLLHNKFSICSDSLTEEKSYSPTRIAQQKIDALIYTDISKILQMHTFLAIFFSP